MKGKLERRIFAIILLYGLIMLFFIQGEEEQYADGTATGMSSLQNESLYIENDGEKTIIGGKGELSNDDLEYLLDSHSLKTTDVVHLIIKEGITDIGYNCLNGYTFLESLYLNSTVESVHNGAIKNCTALKYLYLPGETKTGKDFLFNCGNVFVITDRAAEELSNLFNVPAGYIRGNVDSFEMLLENLRTYPYLAFGSGELGTDDPTAADPGAENMVLHSGYLQNGPYATVIAGTNRIEIKGSGYNKLTGDNMYINVAGTVMEKSNVAITPEQITYYAVFNESASGVEFCLKNNSVDGSEITISSLAIFYEGINLPNVIKEWW